MSQPPSDGDTPTAIDRAAATIDLAETDFRRLFEAVNDAILLVDTEGDRITWANDRACSLLGYSREQLRTMEPQAIHPHEYEQFRSFVGDVLETGEGWTSTLSCYTRDDEVIPAEISGTRVSVDGTPHLLASIRDISTRVEQRERLGRQAAAMAAATDGIAIYTDDGTVVDANKAYADLFGFDDADGVLDHTWAALHEDPERFSLEIDAGLASDGEWRGELTAKVLPESATAEERESIGSETTEERKTTESAVTTGPAGAARTDPSALDGRRPIDASLTRLETDEILCVAHDNTDRRTHERRLTGLAAASRALLAAESEAEVGQVAVDTVADVLGIEAVCFRRYDTEANELRLTARSPAATRLRETAVAYDLNRSRAGAAYRRGESVRNEPGEDAYDDGPARADLHVPVGDAGVLSVFEPSGSFADRPVHLVELFAESVRAAFVRADREARLRARRAELEARTDELTVTTAFTDLLTELVGQLLRATHREALEALVCERLVEAGRYEAAWVATVDEGSVSVSTHRVETGAFVETDPEAFVDSPFATALVREVAETGAPAVSRRQFDSPAIDGANAVDDQVDESHAVDGTDTDREDDAGDDTARVDDAGHIDNPEESANRVDDAETDTERGGDGASATAETLAAAVPIPIGSRRVGVLAVAGVDDRGFGEAVRSGLELLGEALGFALGRAAVRSTLIADDAIELEFAVTERFAELSAALECACRYAGSRVERDGRRYHIRIRGAEPAAARSFLESSPGVSACHVLEERSDGGLLGVSVDDPAPEILADAGVNLRSLVAEGGESRLVVEAPESIDVGALRSALADRYGPVRLVSKQRSRRARSIESRDAALAERLTDKQLTVLETAHEAGYYAWPREETAEGVAAELDIASATFHQHLRAAERKLVEAFLDDGE